MRDDEPDHAASDHTDDVGDRLCRDDGGPAVGPVTPPLEAYRIEIEIDEARAEFQLRELLHHLRRRGRDAMIEALNEALQDHNLIAREDALV